MCPDKDYVRCMITSAWIATKLLTQERTETSKDAVSSPSGWKILFVFVKGWIDQYDCVRIPYVFFRTVDDIEVTELILEGNGKCFNENLSAA